MDVKTKAIIRNLIFPVLFIGCVLFVTAFFLPDWYQVVSDSGNVYIYGLFQTCLQSTTGKLCTQTHLLSVDGDWVPAFQTFGCISLICYFVAASLGFLVLCWNEKKKRILCYASVAGSCATCVSLLVMITVFVNQHVNYEGSYQFAFYLAVASLVLVLLGSVLSMLMIVKGFIEPERKSKNKRGGRMGLLISGLRMPGKQMFRPPMGTAFKDFGGRESPIQIHQKAAMFDDMRENTMYTPPSSGLTTNYARSTSISTPINSPLLKSHTLYNTPSSSCSTDSTGRTNISTHANLHSSTMHTVRAERNEDDISIDIIDISLGKDSSSSPEHSPTVLNDSGSPKGKKNASKFSNSMNSSLDLQKDSPVSRENVDIEDSQSHYSCEIPTIQLDNNVSQGYGQNSENSLQYKEKKYDISFKELQDNDLNVNHIPPSKTGLYIKDIPNLSLEGKQKFTPVKNNHPDSTSVDQPSSQQEGAESDQNSKENILPDVDNESKCENDTEQCENEATKDTSRKWKCVVTYVSRNPVKMKYVNKNKSRKKSQPVLDRYSMYKLDQKQNSLPNID